MFGGEDMTISIERPDRIAIEWATRGGTNWTQEPHHRFIAIDAFTHSSLGTASTPQTGEP